MIEERYMRRALEIARKGMPWSFPNPMVGAVITDPDGNIIGEGYHRRCGEAHAEVNAIASVSRRELLSQATMYVTLEPCAHYGRTGPCAKLIIDTGIPNVVVGCRDPFEKVDGKGIEMLRDAGVNVTLGMLEDECRSLNAIFFTAHTLHRPFVILKWAETADGYIDIKRAPGTPALQISCPMTRLLTHQLRAVCDGIIVGSETVLLDDPGLDNRLWPGRSPRPIILDRRRRVTPASRVMQHDPIIIDKDQPLQQTLAELYGQGFTSVLVEGGSRVLASFIEAGLWDLARVETAPVHAGASGAAKAPSVPADGLVKVSEYDRHIVKYFTKNRLIDVKNL